MRGALLLGLAALGGVLIACTTTGPNNDPPACVPECTGGLTCIHVCANGGIVSACGYLEKGVWYGADGGTVEPCGRF